MASAAPSTLQAAGQLLGALRAGEQRGRRSQRRTLTSSRVAAAASTSAGRPARLMPAAATNDALFGSHSATARAAH
jgi:hypothetical protein